MYVTLEGKLGIFFYYSAVLEEKSQVCHLDDIKNAEEPKKTCN